MLERIISREVIPNHNLTQPSYALRFRTQGGAVAVTSSSARFFVLGEEELFTGAALILPRPKAAIAIFPAIPSNPDELKDN